MSLVLINESTKRSKFEEFVADNLSRMNRYAHSLVNGDSDLAKDLVQDAIIKAYTGYLSDNFELSARGRAWLVTVIRNEYLMHRRKYKRVENFANDEENELTGIGEKAYDKSDLKSIVDQALGELPDDQRECVLLVDIHQYDYEEAAMIIGVPVGTVRSRLSRARVKLATRLASLENL
jgi:RNA polymerase sigma-70 factor, ECF subfamily